MKKFRLGFFMLLLLACFSSCAYLQGNTSQSERDYHLHTVRFSGETMGAIARWYTGETRNWKTIAGLNESISPRSISIGDQILIPKDLVITSEPLPRNAIKRRKLKRSKKGKQSPAKTSSEAKNVEKKEVSSPKKDIPTPIAQPGFEDEKSEISVEREQLLDELLK